VSGRYLAKKATVKLAGPGHAGIPRHTVESSDGTFVAQDDDVAMFRMCICANKGRFPSQIPQSQLDQGADGKYEVRCS
jgi:hypothetical protein